MVVCGSQLWKPGFGKWTSCSEIRHVLETKDHVTICVESKERTWELMIYPVVGGFRMVAGKKGFFDGKPEAFSMEESEHAYIIRSKEHEMILKKETLEISIDRKAITNLKNISFIFEKESVSASRIQFSIHENSAIYGFGERFDSVNQYGKTVALWQRDACEGCLASIGNQAYKNIPLVHTSDGFSFLQILRIGCGWMWEMLCKTIFRWKHLEMFLILYLERNTT